MYVVVDKHNAAEQQSKPFFFEWRGIVGEGFDS